MTSYNIFRNPDWSLHFQCSKLPFPFGRAKCYKKRDKFADLRCMEEHSFGYWLRLRRKALDLTQDVLADRVGCSVGMIRKIESEERRPSAQIAERLAEIFNISQPERTSFLRFARGNLQFAPAETKTEFPWNTSSKFTRSNLPVTVTSLIGREREIVGVREYLLSADIRLVTLIGPPGIGKTRLSIEVAHESLNDFPDGVFFVPLASVDDPNFLAQTVTQAIAFVEKNDVPAAKQLIEGIGEKRILMVLDNCEHLIESVAPLVSDLLSKCSRLKILCTSRESLRISAEWHYPVAALDHPKESSPVDLNAVLQFPALRLFAERARAVKPDFDLNPSNIEAVAAICTQLDGLPLAIELIAPRIRLMSPESLVSRLNDQFILFADGMRASSVRQKTLHNAIAWSYNLLSREEQKLFARVSVFSGGFTLETAEAMFSRVMTEKPVTDLITSLLDKSLLQHTLDSEARSEPRFTMLVTIQQFALDCLRRDEKESETRDWHLEYYRALAEQGQPHLRSTQQLVWLEHLETELDNIRAALNWAENGGSVQAGLHLIADLSHFWIYRANVKRSRVYVEKLLAKPEAAEDKHAHAKGLLTAGILAYFSGDRVTARSHFEASEALWQQLGEAGKIGLVETRDFLIDVYFQTDNNFNLAQLRRYYEDNLKLSQEGGHPWHIAQATFEIAWVARREGNLEAAQRGYESSIAMFRALGDNLRAAGILAQEWGPMALEVGNYAKARALLEEGLAIYRQARHQLYLDVPLYLLGVIAIREGDYARAKEWYFECLKFEQDSGETRYVAKCFLGFAGIASAEHRTERAVRLLGATEVMIEAGEAWWEDSDQAEYEHLANLLRTQLDEVTFITIWAAGRAMTMEQAFEYALELSRDS